MIRLLTYLITMFLFSCSKLEDEADVAASNKLQVFTSRSELLANSADTTKVFARVPEASGRLDVTFTITAGIFVQSGTKSIKHYADSSNGEYRYAEVVLRSDSTKGKVYITAETGTSREIIEIMFKP